METHHLFFFGLMTWNGNFHKCILQRYWMPGLVIHYWMEASLVSTMARTLVIPVLPVKWQFSPLFRELWKLACISMKTSCNSCIFRQFRENLLYFYSIRQKLPTRTQRSNSWSFQGFAPWTPILMIDVVFLYKTGECHLSHEAPVTPVFSGNLEKTSCIFTL